MNYDKKLLVNDTYFETGSIGTQFENFVSPNCSRLTGPPRKGVLKVTEIILHETVTRNTPITIGVLKKRNLGAHLIVSPEGYSSQHGDLVLDQLAHAGSIHNPSSLGIEIVNPYYPKYNIDGPWETVIDAHWAHKKKYVVPMPAQAETVWRTVRYLTQLKQPRFDVPLNFVGLDRIKKRFAMGRITRARWRIPGVIAHTAFGHADGAWPMLYCIIRQYRPDEGPEYAYEAAIQRAEACRWYADLRGIL